MARLPGYIQLQGKPYMRDGACFQDVRIRPWHPSLLAALWRIMDVRPVAAKPALVFFGWVRLILNSSHIAHVKEMVR